MPLTHLCAGRGVTFSHPGQSPVFRELTFALSRGDRIGLVGPNGGGKSTLLRLVAGLLRPAGGKLIVVGRVAFLPQSPSAAELADQTVAGALGIAAKLSALRRVRLGSVALEDYEIVGNDWDVEERAKAELASLGLGALTRESDFLGRSLAQVSGGEQTRIRLAGLLLARPDVLLLDEPTNHLDEAARDDLRSALARFDGVLLVASHDRTLLSTFDGIWELDAAGLRAYGGNYDFYVAQKEIEEAARLNDVAAARQALAGAKEAQVEAREKQQRRMAAGRLRGKAGGIPRIAIGGLKRKAEKTLARVEDVHAQRVAGAEGLLADAKEALVDPGTLKIDLRATAVPRSKLVLEISRMESPLWQIPLSGRITGPERIALVGANGAGKTTLLRRILSADPSTRLGVERVAYLDQRVELLDDDASVLENFRRRTPDTTETERRIKLGRFLFGGDAALKLGRDLSGGERVRAGLACVLLSERPPELLLLDEPGNHLDQRSLRQLEDALRAFAGALVVVSHDRRFREEIGCDRVWNLSSQGLQIS